MVVARGLENPQQKYLEQLLRAGFRGGAWFWVERRSQGRKRPSTLGSLQTQKGGG